jgi:hypothetical protein
MSKLETEANSEQKQTVRTEPNLEPEQTQNRSKLRTEALVTRI